MEQQRHFTRVGTREGVRWQEEACPTGRDPTKAHLCGSQTEPGTGAASLLAPVLLTQVLLFTEAVLSE